jgi:hypothetical protein
MDKDLKELISNIKQTSWKTSLLGFLLFTAATASVLTGKATWSDAMIALTAGVAFIYSKDADK